MPLILAVACAPAAPSPTAAPKQDAPKTTAPAASPAASPSAKPAASPAASPAAQTSGAAAPAAQPKTNRLVIGIAPPQAENNSPRAYQQPDAWQLRPMYEYLIGIDSKDGKYVPQLATEWALEPNGQSFRFKLRQGVKFHDNQGDFSARDVVHTFADFTAQESTHAQAPLMRRLLKEVQVVGDHEVIVHLNQPDAGFLGMISQEQSGMEIRSKQHADAAGQPGMEARPIAGTGPYQFKERAQGQYIRFDRVPYAHWRTNPEHPELEYRFQREASTRLAALIAGETHITNLPEDLLVQAQRQGMEVKKGNVPALRTFMSFLCCFPTAQTREYPEFPNSPLLDARVRMALNKAVNRDEMNKAFHGGKAETMILSHFHPTRLGWNPEWQAKFQDEYGFDPAKARALLSEAGYGPGKPLRTNSFVQELPSVAGAPDMVEAIAGYHRAIGVEVELLNVDRVQISEGMRNHKYDNHLNIVVSSATQIVGFGAFNSMHGADWGSGVKMPETDAVMGQILKEMDLTKQAALWRQLGDMAFKNQMAVPLFWLPAELVVNPKIVGDFTYPGSPAGTWTHLEDVKAAR